MGAGMCNEVSTLRQVRKIKVKRSEMSTENKIVLSKVKEKCDCEFSPFLFHADAHDQF